MYDTVDEANQKLRHTVVLYDKTPCYINDAVSNKYLGLSFTHLRSGTNDMKPINDKNWEFRDLGSKVGYLNIELGTGSYNEAIHLTRMPVRQSHNTQGISQKNLHIPGMKGSDRYKLSPHVLAFAQIYSMSQFQDMMEDKYPDLKDIEREMIKKPWVMSRAFHRQFSVRRDDVGPFYLQYRGRDIGHSDSFYNWKIANQFSYLNETLDHLKLKVA